MTFSGRKSGTADNLFHMFLPTQEYPGEVNIKSRKRHNFTIRDGMADIYGSHEKVPKTLIVPDQIRAMKNLDGTFLPGIFFQLVSIHDKQYALWCSDCGHAHKIRTHPLHRTAFDAAVQKIFDKFSSDGLSTGLTVSTEK